MPPVPADAERLARLADAERKPRCGRPVRLLLASVCSLLSEPAWLQELA